MKQFCHVIEISLKFSGDAVIYFCAIEDLNCSHTSNNGHAPGYTTNNPILLAQIMNLTLVLKLPHPIQLSPISNSVPIRASDSTKKKPFSCVINLVMPKQKLLYVYLD